MQKLEKTAAAWALTAWRLQDGLAVYRSVGGWSAHFGDAAVFRSRAEADTALAASGVDIEEGHIVNPYLLEVANEGGGPFPATVRERLRAFISSVG